MTDPLYHSPEWNLHEHEKEGPYLFNAQTRESIWKFNAKNCAAAGSTKGLDSSLLKHLKSSIVSESGDEDQSPLLKRQLRSGRFVNTIGSKAGRRLLLSDSEEDESCCKAGGLLSNGLDSAVTKELTTVSHSGNEDQSPEFSRKRRFRRPGNSRKRVLSSDPDSDSEQNESSCTADGELSRRFDRKGTKKEDAVSQSGGEDLCCLKNKLEQPDSQSCLKSDSHDKSYCFVGAIVLETTGTDGSGPKFKQTKLRLSDKTDSGMFGEGGTMATNDPSSSKGKHYTKGNRVPSNVAYQKQGSSELEDVCDGSSSEPVGVGLFRAASWMSADSAHGMSQLRR